MKPLLQAFLGDRFRDAVRSLALAVVYEEIESHRRATSLYEFLVQELPESAELTATWWRTSLVGDPKLARLAARAIAGSDFVIVSVSGAAEPSVGVRAWIDSWPFKPARAPRLMTLVQAPQELAQGPSLWESFLRQVASRHDMLYMPGPMALSAELGSPSRSGVDRESTQPPRRITEPYLHWGLNE